MKSLFTSRKYLASIFSEIIPARASFRFSTPPPCMHRNQPVPITTAAAAAAFSTACYADQPAFCRNEFIDLSNNPSISLLICFQQEIRGSPSTTTKQAAEVEEIEETKGMTETFEHSGDHNEPGWKVPKNYLRGYTGNSLSKPLDEDALNAKYRRRMIRGYSGFIPESRTVSGRPIIPSDDVQKRTIDKELGTGVMGFERTDMMEEQKDLHESFKEYAKHMDLLERYADATNQLLARGQTPEMLLKLVQAKISERVHSYSEQFITVKLRFETAGECIEHGFDEIAFRECLEKMNIQLDDVQSLALFSWFDTESTGLIRWEDFAAYAMVANPRGGTAVRPKSITATRESGSWNT